MWPNSEYIAVVTTQSACYWVTVAIWLWNTTILLWVVASKRGGWPSHVIFSQIGMVPSWRLCEPLYYSHVTYERSPCSPWNTPWTLLRLECCVQCLVIGFLGPFSSKNINPERCTNIDYEFLGHLTEEEISEAWFQQDGTIFHIAQAPIRELTLCRSEIQYFRKEYGLNVCRICHCQIFFFYEDSSKNACSSNMCDLDELKTDISNIIADISPLLLRAVSTDKLRCAQLCVQHDDIHFQNFIWQDIL
jgi:hypothetical protein